jgi:hypothetical protein
MLRRHYTHARRCANPRCEDVLAPMTRIRLCPSCRAAGAWGSALAGVAGLLIKLLIAAWGGA